MANRIRIDTRLLNVAWEPGTSYRIDINPGLAREVGNNRSFSPGQENAKTFTTFNTGPTITSVTPAVGATNSFATTATITFNRTIYENPTPSNFFLYKDVAGGPDELVATLTTASSRVVRVGNTVTVDLKNLVDSSSTYYLQSSDPLYRDMFNFPNEQLSQAKFSYTTGRPNIDDVTPDFGTTGSFATTAVISYDRDVKKRSGNFYLYKEGIVDELIETFTTASSKVSIDGDDVSIDLRYLLNGESTYYITSDYGAVDDLITNFRAEPVTEEKFKYSTGPGPKPIAVSPAYASTGSFVSTATITFDKPITLYSNVVYLYKNDTVYRTLPVGSTNLRVINGNTLEVTIYDQPIPEDVYYIGFDLGVVIDSNTFSAVPVEDDSLVKWTSKSITDIPDDTYNSRTTTPIFDNTWFNVLDRSPNANEPYTLTLIATSGTFTASGGISVGNTWIYTGTNQQISNIGGVGFVADVKDMNWDLPVQTLLAKQGTTLAVRNNTIVGLPYDTTLTLVSNTFTNSVGSSTAITVVANTSSPITTTATFKRNGIVVQSVPFVGNSATVTFAPNTLPLGTSSFVVEWNGQTYAPKFNSTVSNTIAQTILQKSITTPTLTLSTDTFFLNTLVEPNTNTFVTATVRLSNIYPTHEPLGEIKLYQGQTLLSTANLTQGVSSSTGVLTWKPIEFNQLDTGPQTLRMEFDGDFWNFSTSTTAAFLAKTRRTPPRLILNLGQSTVMKKEPFNAVVTGTNMIFFSGRTINFNSGGTTLTNVIAGGGTVIGVLNGANLAVGSNIITAAWDGNFGFENTVSNTASILVSKYIAPITITINTSSQFRPNNAVVTATTTLPYYDGESFTLFRGATPISTATFSGSRATFTFNNSNQPLGSNSISLVVPEDVNNAPNSSNTLTFTVSKTTNNLSVQTPLSVVRRPTSFQVTVTSVLNYNVGKTIELYRNDSLLTQVNNFTKTHTFSFNSSAIDLGTSTVYAKFVEDDDYVGVQSPNANFTIDKGILSPLTLTISTATIDKPYTFALTASTPDAYHNGKFFEFVQVGGSVVGTALVSGNSATTILNSMNFTTGTYTFFARSIEDSDYYAQSSNAVTATIQDRTSISLQFIDGPIEEGGLYGQYDWNLNWGNVVPSFEVRPQLVSYLYLISNQQFYSNKTVELYNQAGKIGDFDLSTGIAYDNGLKAYQITVDSTTFDEIDNDFYFKWSENTVSFSTQTNIAPVKVYDTIPPALTITSPDIVDTGNGVLQIVYQRPETAVIQVTTTSSYYNGKSIELWSGLYANNIPTKQFITSSTVVSGVATFELDSTTLPLGINYFVARFAGEGSNSPQIATTSGFFFTSFNFAIRIDE